MLAVFINVIELELDITDEDGVHSFGSSSQLVRMNLDEHGKDAGLYRAGIVGVCLLDYNTVETCSNFLWLLLWSK